MSTPTPPPPADLNEVPPTPPPHSSPVIAIHKFDAENDDELPFDVGERLVVVEKDEVYGDGWWRVSLSFFFFACSDLAFVVWMSVGVVYEIGERLGVGPIGFAHESSSVAKRSHPRYGPESPSEKSTRFNSNPSVSGAQPISEDVEAVSSSR
jgi:hypothetical protein